jgi:hypothetical protein
MMDMDPVLIELQPRERPERPADIQPGNGAERKSADGALANSIEALQVFASTLDEGMETTDLADALPDRISQLRHMVDQARGLLENLIAINREYVDKTAR